MFVLSDFAKSLVSYIWSKYWNCHLVVNYFNLDKVTCRLGDFQNDILPWLLSNNDFPGEDNSPMCTRHFSWCQHCVFNRDLGQIYSLYVILRTKSYCAVGEVLSLGWRHNDLDDISSHRRLGCILKRLFRRRSKKLSKLRIPSLCDGHSPLTGEFPAQRASYS